MHIRITGSIKGTRAVTKITTVRGRSINLIASLSMSGMGYCNISTSTINAIIFSEYHGELCKYLLSNQPEMENACLIFDNARIHIRDDISRITTRYSYSFKFLPQCFYMPNQIENAFSKIKNNIRSRLLLRLNDNL